jgi:non-ribosomal peptide synthetase component F
VLPLIGYFINLVVLRTQSVSGRSFPAALETVRDLMMQVTSHQDLPFDMLCQAFNKAGLMPPYPAMAFQHLDSVPGLPVFPGLTATEWKDDVKKPMMPWGLSMETAEVNDQLRIRFSFDKRLYDPEAVAAMHLACCRLLEEAASLVES